MRLLGRHDKPLAVGLVIGILIIFERPLRFLLEVARDIESRYQVDLVPALTVLCGVYVFHQYQNWQDAKAEAAAAAAEARQAQERSHELERLINFGRALAKALDVPALQQVLWQRLPQFVQERDMWVLMCGTGKWEPLVQEIGPHARETADKLVDLATRALAIACEDEAHAEGDFLDGHLCFPMLVGERPVGVLGVRQGREALTPAERRALGTAAALLAIAVRNVQWFQENRNNSLRDSLTGCFNRAYGMETLDAQLRLAKRASWPLSIIMFDIDEFKGVNDRFGHLAGDALLAGVGRQLGNVLRASDIKCRARRRRRNGAPAERAQPPRARESWRNSHQPAHQSARSRAALALQRSDRCDREGVPKGDCDSVALVAACTDIHVVGRLGSRTCTDSLPLVGLNLAV